MIHAAKVQIYSWLDKLYQPGKSAEPDFVSFILLTQGFYCKNNGLNGNELRDFVCLYILADLRLIKQF